MTLSENAAREKAIIEAMQACGITADEVTVHDFLKYLYDWSVEQDDPSDRSLRERLAFAEQRLDAIRADAVAIATQRNLAQDKVAELQAAILELVNDGWSALSVQRALALVPRK